MRLMNLIKSLINRETEQRPTNNCTHKIVLRHIQFNMLIELFNAGSPIYREIGKLVYQNNVKKMFDEVFEPLNNMADNGCKFDQTYIKFYSSSSHISITIPLEVFATKVKIKTFDRMFRSKWWFKESKKNIQKYFLITNRR